MTHFSYKTLPRHKQASSRSFANEEQPRAVALVQWDVIMSDSRVAPRFRLRSNRRHKRASSTACRGRAVLIERQIGHSKGSGGTLRAAPAAQKVPRVSELARRRRAQLSRPSLAFARSMPDVHRDGLKRTTKKAKFLL